MKDHRNWFKYLKWSLFVLAFLGVVFMGAVFGFRYYIRRGMTPAQLAEIERFSEPVEIPEGWQKVEPFPPEVVEAVERFEGTSHLITEVADDYWELYDKIKSREDFSPEWSRVEEVVRKAKPCTDALKVMVALPGYDMSALSPREGSGPWLASEKVSPSVGTLCLGARYNEHTGEYDQAFENCIAALRLLKRHPASPMIVHMNAMAQQTLPTSIICRLARVCEDPAILEEALNDMSRLAPDLVLDVFEDPRLVDIVGLLRTFARLGYDVDLTSGKPRSYYFRQMANIWPEVMGAQNPLIYSDNRTLLEKTFYSTPLGNEYQYSLGLDHLGTLRMVDLSRSVWFDMARLAVASRIFELRTGAKPTGMSDLVPDCFPEPLIDPFSEKPYLWSEKWQTFFSVGENGIAELDSMTLTEEGYLEDGDDIASVPKESPDQQ